MRIKITKEFNITDLQKEINQVYPDYKTSIRQGRILVVKKSGSAAAMILGGKNGKAIVNEGFPTMGQQMVFVFTLILLGILIPLIIYFAAFYPQQKAIRNEMADYIKSQYGGA